MPATAPTLTVHRATSEIGGNCIELAFDGHRIILDAGSRLSEPSEADALSLPPSLDVGLPTDGLIISHPHQDHCGLLRALPKGWPVWSGTSAEVLIRMTAALWGGIVPQEFRAYKHARPFEVGPFKITPYLTYHSAFDA